MLPIEVILALELTTNQNVIKWQYFKFISRIFTYTLIKIKMILEMLPLEYTLASELTTNENVMKWLCFEFLFGILTCILSFRRRITQIYIFKVLFDFFNIWATSCGFQKLELSLSKYALSFNSNEPYFCCLNVLVCCCAANQQSKYTSLFPKI